MIFFSPLVHSGRARASQSPQHVGSPEAANRRRRLQHAVPWHCARPAEPVHLQLCVLLHVPQHEGAPGSGRRDSVGPVRPAARFAGRSGERVFDDPLLGGQHPAKDEGFGPSRQGQLHPLRQPAGRTDVHWADGGRQGTVGRGTAIAAAGHQSGDPVHGVRIAEASLARRRRPQRFVRDVLRDRCRGQGRCDRAHVPAAGHPDQVAPRQHGQESGPATGHGLAADAAGDSEEAGPGGAVPWVGGQTAADGADGGPHVHDVRKDRALCHDAAGEGRRTPQVMEVACSSLLEFFSS